jgi:hypothetical protein
VPIPISILCILYFYDKTLVQYSKLNAAKFGDYFIFSRCKTAEEATALSKGCQVSGVLKTFFFVTDVAE